MKILILANSDIGLYKFRRELIAELLKENSVYISVPNGEYIQPLVNSGCIFIDSNIDRRGINPFKDGKLIKEYFMLIRRIAPDLVITYTIKPNVYGGIVCRILKKTYVVNITGLGSAFEKGGWLSKVVTIMNRVACKDAKVVFFENEQNRRYFVEKKIVCEEKTYRLNGAGVNTQYFQVYEYPRGEKIRFLFMGRVMKEKGVEELFAAMHRLYEEGVNCCLDVLGGYEEDYKEIIDKYEKEGWLKYYGYQDDVRPYIARAHCFVLPSWHEGMANTNLESAACGRPIITTNISGCKEAIIPKVSGFLVEKCNVTDLYHKLKLFINMTYEERKGMGLAGRTHIEKNFDKREIVFNTLNEINRV